MYAHYRRLIYFCTECIYSPNAYRGYVREFIKDLERHNPKSILDIIDSAEYFSVKNPSIIAKLQTCQKCGYISSRKFCKACVLLEGLNKGCAKLVIGKRSKDACKNMHLIAEKNLGKRYDDKNEVCCAQKTNN